MRTVKLKSGGHANVLSGKEMPIEGEINFYSEKELSTALKLGRDIYDPEAQKEFWKTLLEKKRADLNYSLLKDFPEIISETKDFPGKEICKATIDMLRGKIIKEVGE